MNIKTYKKVESLEEGYQLLNDKRNNCVLGGCTFIKQTKKQINVAVDLIDCGMDYIKETDENVIIGAYTTLRDMETSPIINNCFGDVFNEIFKHFIGVQLRNHITIGAHVYSKFGFSDIIPLLISLNTKVRLYKNELMTLEEFMNAGIKKDILTEVIIPKQNIQTKVQMMRNSYNDYSLFCLAVSKSNNNDWRIVAGVRPGKATLAYDSMEYLKGYNLKDDDIEEIAEKISNEFVFGSNIKASAEYRKQLCYIFAKRALKELSDGN